MKNLLTKFTLIIFASVLSHSATAQVLPKKGNPPQRIYGLTIENLEDFEDADVKAFEQAFNDVTVPITLRIVFQPHTLPSQYDKQIRALRSYPSEDHRKFYIMALPFDSDALAKYKLVDTVDPNFDCEKLPLKQIKKQDMNYNQRAQCFVNHFKGVVDAWEIGNEVNGEWADEQHHKYKDDPSHIGDYATVIKKIDTVLKLVSPNKDTKDAIALTLTYQPKCGEWNDNAIGEWIKHLDQLMIDQIDYILISYYEDKCFYKVLDKTDFDSYIIKPLRDVFKQQFIAVGEIGYSVGEGENSEECTDDKNCYCSVKKTYCDEKSNETKKGKKMICRKSKISQMQRYFTIKPDDDKFVGGGFWWNAGKDFRIDNTYNKNLNFLTSLKNVFSCLSANQNCVTPIDVDCPQLK